jgi:serine protease Do
VAKPGDSDKLRIGDPVFTIGNPLEVGTSVSAGIVSALDRDLRNTPYDNFIQTDAAINYGNSGGPMVNANGEVVGVDTAMVSPTASFAGLGFAITSNDMALVVERLRRFGAVRAGWIGAQLQDLTSNIAEGLGLNRPVGAIVVSLDANEPAARAGLNVGDVVTAVNGTPCRDGRQVMRSIALIDVGKPTTLTVFRDSRERQIEVIVGVFPGDAAPTRLAPASATLTAIAEKPDLGIKLSGITDSMRRRYSMNVKSGAVIASVDPKSAAGAAGLVPGDVVLRVQNMPVTSPADFKRALKATRKLGRHFVLLLVRKKNAWQWVAVLSKPQPAPSPRSGGLTDLNAPCEAGDCLVSLIRSNQIVLPTPRVEGCRRASPSPLRPCSAQVLPDRFGATGSELLAGYRL